MGKHRKMNKSLIRTVSKTQVIAKNIQMQF